MSTPWHQVNIEFPEPATAETVAADHLAPALTAWQHAGFLHQ